LINEVLNELQTAEFQGGPSDSPRQYHYTRLRQKWRAPHFDLDGSLPLLPLATQDRAESGDLLKSLIREFLTIHYRLASGKPSVVIPWFCLEEHRNRLWESEMWPEDVKIRDPSKLTVPCCKEILKLWRGQQQIGGASRTFCFSFFIEDKELSPALYDLSQQLSTPVPNTRNIGSVAALPTTAPNGRIPARPVRGHLPPNASTEAHLSSTAGHMDQTLIGSPDQALDPQTVPNAPTPQPLDGPESDPPILKKKGKQAVHVQSDDYTTDPATEDETVKRCRGPQRNLALEDAMDRNSEGAAPISLQKAWPKPKRITKKCRRQRPTSAEEQGKIDEWEDAVDRNSDGATPIPPQKAHPKPKPVTKQLPRQGPITPEEQRNIEDGLFL